MRLLQVLAAAAFLVACGTQPPAGGGASFGTVTGHVVSYPCAPVERAGSPCPGRPAAHVEVDFAIAGKAPVRAITDAAGVYVVQLGPGTYQVSLGVLRPTNGPHTVSVSAGSTVTANYVFDSGIR